MWSLKTTNEGRSLDRSRERTESCETKGKTIGKQHLKCRVGNDERIAGELHPSLLTTNGPRVRR